MPLPENNQERDESQHTLTGLILIGRAPFDPVLSTCEWRSKKGPAGRSKRVPPTARLVIIISPYQVTHRPLFLAPDQLPFFSLAFLRGAGTGAVHGCKWPRLLRLFSLAMAVQWFLFTPPFIPPMEHREA